MLIVDQATQHVLAIVGIYHFPIKTIVLVVDPLQSHVEHELIKAATLFPFLT